MAVVSGVDRSSEVYILVAEDQPLIRSVTKAFCESVALTENRQFRPIFVTNGLSALRAILGMSFVGSEDPEVGEIRAEKEYFSGKETKSDGQKIYNDPALTGTERVKFAAVLLDNCMPKKDQGRGLLRLLNVICTLFKRRLVGYDSRACLGAKTPIFFCSSDKFSPQEKQGLRAAGCFGILEKGSTAVLEMARCLELLPNDKASTALMETKQEEK